MLKKIVFFKKQKNTNTNLNLIKVNNSTGRIYKGTFLIGSFRIEGIYLNDKNSTFIWDNGQAQLSKDINIYLEKGEHDVSSRIEKLFKDVQSGHAVPFAQIV